MPVVQIGGKTILPTQQFRNLTTSAGYSKTIDKFTHIVNEYYYHTNIILIKYND